MTLAEILQIAFAEPSVPARKPRVMDFSGVRIGAKCVWMDTKPPGSVGDRQGGRVYIGTVNDRASHGRHPSLSSNVLGVLLRADRRFGRDERTGRLYPARFVERLQTPAADGGKRERAPQGCVEYAVSGTRAR